MWNSLAFSMIQYMLAVWFLVPLPFLNPACIFGSSGFTYYWSLSWSILSVILLTCEMNATVWQFERCLAFLVFANGMKTDLFQSCGHWWVFQICWHSERSTLTASSFRICNSSAGIPSLPLVLFVVCFLRPSWLHTSGSGWVATPSSSSGSLRSFLYSSLAYSCHLFLISFTSVSSLLFLLFIVPIFSWNVPLVSPIFLKRPVVIPILFFPSVSLHCSLRRLSLFPCYSLDLCIQLGISFRFFFAFCFSSFLSYL